MGRSRERFGNGGRSPKIGVRRETPGPQNGSARGVSAGASLEWVSARDIGCPPGMLLGGPEWVSAGRPWKWVSARGGHAGGRNGCLQGGHAGRASAGRPQNGCPPGASLEWVSAGENAPGRMGVRPGCGCPPGASVSARGVSARGVLGVGVRRGEWVSAGGPPPGGVRRGASGGRRGWRKWPRRG